MADILYIRKENGEGTSSQEALYRYFSLQKVSLEDALMEEPEEPDEYETPAAPMEPEEPEELEVPEESEVPETPEETEETREAEEPEETEEPQEPEEPAPDPVSSRRSSFSDWLHRLTK